LPIANGLDSGPFQTTLKAQPDLAAPKLEAQNVIFKARREADLVRAKAASLLCSSLNEDRWQPAGTSPQRKTT